VRRVGDSEMLRLW